MFDAYTVKKVLPRLAIAVILIQLSWFIFTGMITLTTAVAYGIEGLIYGPFGGVNEFSLSALLGGSTPSAGIVGGGNGIFTLAVIAGGAAVGLIGGLGVIFSLALSAFIAILFGFALLMFRQVLIVALLVISPLALVAWILPNTEKFWKIWWESFSKLLIVFPMIVAVIAIGRVFAFITSTVRPAELADNLFSNFGVDTLIRIVFVVIGFFGPYFFIPKLFMLAGSAFAFFAGMANDREKGIFDRLKKGRADTRAKNVQGLKTGERFKGNNALTRPFANLGNRLGTRATAGPSAAILGGSRLQAARSENIQSAANELLKDQNFVQATYNDGVRKALQLGSDSAAKAAGVSAEDRATAKRIGYNNVTRVAALKAEGSNKGRNFKDEYDGHGNLTRDAVGEANASIRAAAAAAGINETDLREEVSYGLRTNGGRFDLGALNPNKTRQEQIQSGWGKGSLYQIANGQPDTITNAAHNARTLLAHGNEDDKHQAAMIYEELDALSKNATGAARDAAMSAKADLQPHVDAYYAGGTPTDVPVYGEVTGTVANPPAGDAAHNPHVAVGDPIEVTRKVVVGQRQESDRKLKASNEARKYEPIDPNNI